MSLNAVLWNESYFLLSPECERSLCLKKRRDTVTVRRELLSVGKVFASSSLSINHTVFMERSGKAGDIASSLKVDSRATQFLMEERHIVLSKRICGFIFFCLITVCNLQKAKAFQWLFFAQWVSVFHFKVNWLFQISLNKNLQSRSKEKKIKYWNIFQNNMWVWFFFSGRDLVLNPVRIEIDSHVCLGRWKTMLLLPPGYQFRNLHSFKIMLFVLFPLETSERTAVTLNMCSHEHESTGEVILSLQCLPCLPGKHTATHKVL